MEPLWAGFLLEYFWRNYKDLLSHIIFSLNVAFSDPPVVSYFYVENIIKIALEM